MKYIIFARAYANVYQDIEVEAENEGLAEKKAKEMLQHRDWKIDDVINIEMFTARNDD